MVSIGNKAKLVNSEICQKCANCCKTFYWNENIDMALRFLWCKSDIIKVEDNPFNRQDVTLNIQCSKLCKVGESMLK